MFGSRDDFLVLFFFFLIHILSICCCLWESRSRKEYLWHLLVHQYVSWSNLIDSFHKIMYKEWWEDPSKTLLWPLEERDVAAGQNKAQMAVLCCQSRQWEDNEVTQQKYVTNYPPPQAVCTFLSTWSAEWKQLFPSEDVRSRQRGQQRTGAGLQWSWAVGRVDKHKEGTMGQSSISTDSFFCGLNHTV